MIKKTLTRISLILLTCNGAAQTQQELFSAAQQFPEMPRETIDMIPFAGGNLAFGSGTPFNDIEYTIMNFDYIDGENGGSDIFMPVRTSEDFPGSNTVKYMRGVLNTDLNESYDTADRDRFILGTAEIDVPFFSMGLDGIDNDYAVIQHFDYDFGSIQLRGEASDYRLLTAELSDGVNTAGNYLFYTKDFNATGKIDLIAFIFPCDDLQNNVSGTPPQDFLTLCNDSKTLSLSDANQFIFATPIETDESITNALVQYGGKGKDVIGGLTQDTDGNLYLMGATDSDLSGNGNANNKIFITKIDNSGNEIWVLDIPLRNGSLIFDAVTDENFVYACGRTLDALPGFTNTGRWDGFLLKINKETGTLVASDQWGNSGIDGYGNIVLDNQGGLYVSGQGSPEGTTGTDDAYLVARHHTSDLSNDWRVIEPTTATGFSASAEAWGGLYWKEGATDASDRLVAAGWYIAAGGANAFVSVFDNLYNVIPNRPHSIVFAAPGPQADWVLDNVIDSQGNIYVAGYTSGNLEGTHQGDGDAFITKYDSTLSNPQTVQFGTPQSDMVRKMNIDDQDHIYLTGYTYGNLFGTNNDPSLTTADIFVHKMDTNLNTLATAQFGTPHEERAYAALADNRLYIGGMTEGVIKETSKGSWDGYAVALDSNDLSIIDTTLSVTDISLLEQTLLYPNPANNYINLKSEVLSGVNNFEIYDIQGRKIRSGTITDNQQQIKISDLQSGIYVMNIGNINTINTLKFMKL